MTEKEANDHLEVFHDDIFFGGTFHKYVNYAAVIKHPFKPNKFAIEAAGVDLKLHYIENYVKKRKSNLLTKLGFNQSFTEKLQDLNTQLEPIELLQIINKSNDFSDEERKKIKFKSKDIYSFNEETFEYLKIRNKIAQQFLQRDIFIENENKIILPLEEESNSTNPISVNIEGGISISNEESDNCRGTLGGIFKIEESDCHFGITNEHVLKYTDKNNFVKSPGNSTVGINGKIIGEVILKSFKGIDVAIINLNNNIPGKHSIVNNYFSFSNSTSNLTIGNKVKKYGITTGYREGVILSQNASIQIEVYGESHFFKNQIMCSPIILSGDSGSILAKDNGEVIGLLFAKSENNAVCFANNLNDIRKFLRTNNIKFKSFV